MQPIGGTRLSKESCRLARVTLPGSVPGFVCLLALVPPAQQDIFSPDASCAFQSISIIKCRSHERVEAEVMSVAAGTMQLLHTVAGGHTQLLGAEAEAEVMSGRSQQDRA